MEEKIKDIMSRVFEVDPDEIQEDSSPYSIETWNSMRHMEMVVSLENEFGFRFDEEEIPTLISFTIIVNTVVAYVE